MHIKSLRKKNQIHMKFVSMVTSGGEWGQVAGVYLYVRVRVCTIVRLYTTIFVYASRSCRTYHSEAVLPKTGDHCAHGSGREGRPHAPLRRQALGVCTEQRNWPASGSPKHNFHSEETKPHNPPPWKGNSSDPP